MNQDKNIKVKVKNIKCARPKYKHIFITISKKNVNTKITKQDYGTKSYFN